MPCQARRIGHNLVGATVRRAADKETARARRDSPENEQNRESNHRLSRAEVDFFVENGYLGPYAAMSPDEMAPIRREIEQKV